MKGTARPWRNGYWRVRMEDGLDIYPINDVELNALKRRHDITVREQVSS